MSKNTKQTSSRVGSQASETLRGRGESQVAKSLAASALSQRAGAKQTSAEMEKVASAVLRSDKYSENTKDLAASVLSQSNKSR